MVSILRSRSALGLLYLEGVPLLASLAIAELFFRFGHFALEAVAFLGVWYLTGVAYTKALSLLARHTRLIPAPERFSPLS